MQRILSLVLAGVVGGMIVLLGMHLTKPEVQVNQDPVSFAQNVKFPSSSAVVMTENFVKAANKAMPAVVHIKASESEILANERRNDNRQRRSRSPFDDFFSFDEFFGNRSTPFYRQQGSGSGVIISKDGYIVTNNHVVGFADEIEVTLHDNRRFVAKKIGTDPSSDLAVIKIEGYDLPTLDYADSDEAQVGEWVLAVGNPFDYLTSTVTAGIISAKGRDINIIRNEKAIEQFIQTDAAINPGNSGGALVNADGDLLGINTAIATPTGSYAGYSFAIPVNLMKNIVQEIIENGDIERANLGVAGIDVDSDLIEEERLSATYGFYVAEVVNGSSASYSGILPGDVIVKLDDQRINGYEDLKEALKFAKVGDRLEVKIDRNGVLKTIPVRLRKGL